MQLITFGCSFTYGHGLSDCYNPHTCGPGKYPSKFAWPQLLANKLNIKSKNLSDAGSSNKQILYTLLEHDFSKTDTVIIMWSFLTRTCIIRKNKITRIMPSSAEEDQLDYYRNQFDEHDQHFELLRCANHAKLHLDKLNIHNIHLHVNPLSLKKYKTYKWNTVEFLDIDMLEISSKHPRALDGSHPGPLAHCDVSDLIYTKFNNNCFIS